MSVASVFPCGHTENEHLAGWGGQSCTLPVSLKPRKMPRQKPGQSKQDYGTPRAFLDAVERRFGSIVFDLAAHASNAVVPFYYGPGSPLGEDSLVEDWAATYDGLGWLNYEFGDAKIWTAKAALEVARGARFGMLGPASVGTNWFAENVDGKALVLAIRPRLIFVPETSPYPKDLILAMYGEPPGFECWRWDQ